MRQATIGTYACFFEQRPGSPGRISAPWPVIWISKPSSGTGGPLDFSVDHGALVEMSSRSTVPACTWSRAQARTFEATVTGHRRFIAATDMRVLAIPISYDSARTSRVKMYGPLKDDF